MVKAVLSDSFMRHQRKAFTMIELIFAIVLIAVVMLTIPTMIQVNNKALEGSTNQEAILLSSSVLSETTTYIWDENSYTSGNQDVTLSSMLDVPTGNNAYHRVDANSSIRIGGLNQDLHRRFGDNAAVVPLQAAGTPAPILPLPVNAFAAGPTGYKFGYTVTANSSYIDDDPTSFVFTDTNVSNQTNVKLLEVSVIDTNTNELLTLLRAYTCNIGEIDYAKRRMP